MANNSDFRGKNRGEIKSMGGSVGSDGNVRNSWGKNTGNHMPSSASTARPGNAPKGGSK